MSERARLAAERLRRDVAAHASEPNCGERDCLLHAHSAPDVSDPAPAPLTTNETREDT